MSEYIGAKFKLLIPALGNSAGTIGYVFNEYQDFDNPIKLGIQIIFPNGNYDGFSWKERERFLEFVGYSLDHMKYKFKNVMQVSKDFDKGYWKF